MTDWSPTATRATLRARARMYREIRRFFSDAGVLEVETPILSSGAVSDPALESFQTACSGRPLWLQTSPEFPMKRLLAAGSGPIYQICKVFRREERGTLHHPEFTLLEWYRPGWGLDALIREVATLVRTLAHRSELPLEIRTYAEIFQTGLGIDPFQSDEGTLAACARTQGIPDSSRLTLDRDGWLDLLLSFCIERTLGRGCLTVVRDYPPSQAALAQIRMAPQPVAERFELYWEGIELANGFRELTDAREQRRRFQRDRERRKALGLETPPFDERFLQALEAGLPPSSGVALGLDRLLLLLLGKERIDEVLAFPIERA